jgi:hypothetical protein
LSALSLFPSDNGVALAADAAGYDKNGCVIYFTNKLHVLERQRCAFGHVGIGSFGGFFREIAEEYRGDFDGLLAELPKFAQAAYGMARADWRSQTDLEPPAATLALGGWSQVSGRFDGFKIHSPNQ